MGAWSFKTFKRSNLNWYERELNYRIHRYRVIGKYVSIKTKIEEIIKVYEFMNTHFMDIHSYNKIKNKKKNKDYLIIGMKRTKELLEYSDKISISKELLFSFQENLKSYIEKIDLYTDIKIILLPKFGDDITECILEYL